MKKQADILSYLCQCSRKVQAGVIEMAHKALIDCLSECALNILLGNVDLSEEQKKKLKSAQTETKSSVY